MSEDSEKILSDSLHAMAQDIKKRDDEIERLRGLVYGHPPTVFAENEQLKAEIERLREELANCLHLDNHNAIVRNRNDEIERLRGLLRYFLATHDSYEIHDRIREALNLRD